MADELPALFEGRPSDFMSRVATAVHGADRKSTHDDPDKAGMANRSDSGPDIAGKPAGSEPETAIGNALSRAMKRLRGQG